MLLIAAPPAAQVADRLAQAGLPAAVVGRFTDGPARELVSAGQTEALRPPDGDELWPLIKRLQAAG